MNVTAIIIAIIIVVTIIILGIVLNNSSDSSTTDKNTDKDTDEDTDKQDSDTYIEIPDDAECTHVMIDNPDFVPGKVLIFIDCQYTYRNDNTFKGVYKLPYIYDVNSIEDEYISIKPQIPSMVFNGIQDVIAAANIDQELNVDNFIYNYPKKLIVFKNDEYLMIISTSLLYKIESYAYDYPYNYINDNKVVTLQSKHYHKVAQTDNTLYYFKPWITDLRSIAACKESNINSLWYLKLCNLYTNKYINFAIILHVYIQDLSTQLKTLDDCKAVFYYFGGYIPLLLSDKEYHKGIFKLSDIKSDFRNICNTLTGVGPRFNIVIDLNDDYYPPIVYDEQNKPVYIFNEGDQILSNDFFINKISTLGPTVKCNYVYTVVTT